MPTHERLEDIPLRDAADHMTTPERIVGYIEAVFEEDDAALLAKAIGDVARASSARAVERSPLGSTRHADMRAATARPAPRRKAN